MSSINPSLYSGLFYQLPGAQKTSGTLGTSSADAVLNVLWPSASQGNPLFGGDILDLSPEAKSLLGDFAGGGAESAASGLNSFILTSGQQTQIDSILATYKDAPFNQYTYNQIQNELREAGLSPDTLAIKDKLSGLNPTSILIDVLDGNDGTANIVDLTNIADVQGKANSYMQQIFQQWYKTSTTASTPSTDVLV